MEIDKTQLTHDVAAKIWASEDFFGINGPLEDQDKVVQYTLKAKVVPILTHALPVMESHFEDRIKAIIATGHSLGLDADMILLDLSTELDK